MESHTPPREVMLKPKAPPAALLQAAMAAKQVLPRDHGHVTLFEDKIHVRDTRGDSDTLPRRYTLTHDDRSAEMFLTVGSDYDREALDQPHTRERRDEVLAELTDSDLPRLTVTCLVSGQELAGEAFDPALRRRIFESEMPFALAVIRYGDRFFYERHPELDQAEIVVEYRSSEPRFQAEQAFGRVSNYRVSQIAGESRRLMIGAAAITALGIGALVYGKMRNR